MELRATYVVLQATGRSERGRGARGSVWRLPVLYNAQCHHIQEERGQNQRRNFYRYSTWFHV